LRSLPVVVTEDDTWTGLRMDKLNNLQKRWIFLSFSVDFYFLCGIIIYVVKS
jgi:hypothetical protein